LMLLTSIGNSFDPNCFTAEELALGGKAQLR
jgi:hypothetical protein